MDIKCLSGLKVCRDSCELMLGILCMRDYRKEMGKVFVKRSIKLEMTCILVTLMS